MWYVLKTHEDKTVKILDTYNHINTKNLDWLCWFCQGLSSLTDQSIFATSIQRFLLFQIMMMLSFLTLSRYTSALQEDSHILKLGIPLLLLSYSILDWVNPTLLTPGFYFPKFVSSASYLWLLLYLYTTFLNSNAPVWITYAS